MPFDEEVIVPFPCAREAVPMGKEFRSTWLAGSLAVIRAHGAFERYLANLPARYHDPILRSVAGTWLPAEVAVAHYRAVDALGISGPERVQWGREITANLQKTIFSVGFSAAREIGVTPWTMLKLVPVSFSREWRGGAVAVFRCGPKDARVEIAGFPCSPIPHCRAGLRGVVMALCDRVCTKSYAQEIRALCTESTLGFGVSWA